MTTTTKKPTLADVSAACGGIHRNTVSKILKGTYQGDLDTINAVQRAAEELGYAIEGKDSTQAAALTTVKPVTDAQLPKGVKLVKPEEKMSRNHEWTMKFEIEVECEWEYDKDDKGNPILETKTCIATEMRSCSQCLPHRPTLREIEMHIALHRASLPDAV